MTSSWRFPGFVTSGDFPFSTLSDLFGGACLRPRVKSAIFFAYFPFQRESDNGKSVTACPRQFPTFPTNLERGRVDFGTQETAKVLKMRLEENILDSEPRKRFHLEVEASPIGGINSTRFRKCPTFSALCKSSHHGFNLPIPEYISEK